MTSTPAGGQAGGEVPSPGEVLRDLADLTVPWALRAAVGAGIPELIGQRGSTFDALLATTTANPRGLDAVLGVLVRHGVLALDGDRYLLTEVGERLLPDHPESRHADLDPSGIRARFESAFVKLPEALSGGKAAYEALHGRSLWDDLAEDPSMAERFEVHLARWAEQWAPVAAADPVWRGASMVVDVGGGLGVLATELVRRYPDVHVVVVERPGTAERAKASVAERSGHDRVRVEVHDAFSSLPHGGDVYVLAQLLHDFDDATAADLLASVVRSAPTGARVAVIERLPAQERIFDHMNLLLFALGGGERSRREYADLLRCAKLAAGEPRPLVGGMWLTECLVE